MSNESVSSLFFNVFEDLILYQCAYVGTNNKAQINSLFPSINFKILVFYVFIYFRFCFVPVEL